VVVGNESTFKAVVSCAIIACNYLGSGRGYRCERGYRCQSVCVCDVTSKMSADEELLLLSAAALVATISLVAVSCKRTRKRKRAKRL